MEDFEHGHSFGCFGCCVVNVFVVCEFKSRETQYWEMCVRVLSNVVELQTKSSVIFCRVSQSKVNNVSKSSRV